MREREGRLEVVIWQAPELLLGLFLASFKLDMIP